MRTLPVAALALLLALPVSAAEITTLAGAAVQQALLETAKTFQAQTGHVVTVTFDTVPNIMRRLGGGESADVLIATAAGVDQAIKDGRAVANTRTMLGRVGIGVAVSTGAAKPDISSPDAVKAAILAADGVVASRGTSGAYVMTLLADLGVLDQVKAKIAQVGSGIAVMERLGTTRNEIGFTMMSEVMYGAAHGGGTLVGPLPRAIQNLTGYEAVVMSASKSPEVARAFVAALRSGAARRLFRDSGFDVPDIRAQ